MLKSNKYCIVLFQISYIINKTRITIVTETLVPITVDFITKKRFNMLDLNDSKVKLRYYIQICVFQYMNIY